VATHRFLSCELGKPVVGLDGNEIGHLVDLSVRLHVSHPPIHRLAIGRGRHVHLLVPWALVRQVDEDRVVLGLDRGAMAKLAFEHTCVLEPDELLLGHDVVDTQVVDLAGRRLSRVSDVLLLVNDLHGRDAEVAAVDLGVGSLLRRIGLRRVGARIEPVIVGWDDLHLASERGHTAQLSTSTPGISSRDPQQLAELLARLSTRKATDVIRHVGPERSAAALRASHPEHRGRLLRGLPPSAAQEVIDAAAPPTAHDLAQSHGEARPRRWLRTAGWRVHHPPRAGARGNGPVDGDGP
jgi:sporulation protein YlmC with PRC-barrel domain